MKYAQLIILGCFLYGCVPVTPSSTSSHKKLQYDDINYEFNIGMVQLYPVSNNEQATLDYPVIGLEGSGLRLVFDLWEKNASYLNVRYVHCNADWSPSRLQDIQMLNSYNEFPVNDFEYSSNTRIPYVKYSVSLPTPMKSGNYILIVYRENDRDDIVFSRRFLVFDQKAKINVNVRASTSVADRYEYQQVEFDVAYRGLDHPNPLREFRVVLLQNHNWNTWIAGLKPTLIRNDRSYLEYRQFTGENNFPGLNEFRFFDLRSIDFRGMNVARISKQEDRISAYLGIDQSRGDQAYAQVINDFNGGFYLQNTDPNDDKTQSEYVNVHFEVESPQLESDVYIAGRYNNWKLGSKNKMTYSEDTKSYSGSVLLKQGYYDYFYWVDGTDPYYVLEGSHYQTANDYEVLFYYRNPFNDYDELIGYRMVSSGN